MAFSLKRFAVLRTGFTMDTSAPKGRTQLSADALFRLVRTGLGNIPDHRPPGAEMLLSDALMSAFAMFSLKTPSVWAFDQHRAEGN